MKRNRTKELILVLLLIVAGYLAIERFSTIREVSAPGSKPKEVVKKPSPTVTKPPGKKIPDRSTTMVDALKELLFNQQSLEERLKEAGGSIGDPIFIRIFKQEKSLEVWGRVNQHEKSFTLIKTYPICYFSGNLGPKLAEGDRQSPEGFYFVTKGQLNPNSRYHLSFNIGYPNQYDRSHNRTGSAIMVHGSCASLGCYAMTDNKIDDIYRLASGALSNGQPFFRVHIFPFKMNDQNMNKHAQNRWSPFWLNLKEGYDLFEQNKIPPNVKVNNGNYQFD